MGLKTNKGAGYSIEAILAVMILVIFAFGSIESPPVDDWTPFQREVAAHDISYTMHDSGVLNEFLRNSDTGAIQETASALSAGQMEVSGSVRNLPIADINVGFNARQEDIHRVEAEPLTSTDPCYGDLAEIVLKTDPASEIRVIDSGDLYDDHRTRLYIGDTDPRMPEGFDSIDNPDSLWVNNGTDCVFSTEHGPHFTGTFFNWGNETDSYEEKIYEFVDFDTSTDEAILHEANLAFDVQQKLNEPVNNIDTSTTVTTFNLDNDGVSTYDVLVFPQKESLDSIEDNIDKIEDFVEQGSIFLLMDLEEADMNNEFIDRIGFEWVDLDVEGDKSDPGYSFSKYSVSETVRTYFVAVGGEQSRLSLEPGGKINSGGSAVYRTSRNDLLSASNVAYNVEEWHGTRTSSWDSVDNCPRTEEASFEFDDEEFDVLKREIDQQGCNPPFGVSVKENGEHSDIHLEDETLVVNGMRYTPIFSENGQEVNFKFVGSERVELINHKIQFDDMEGRSVARAGYSEEYNDDDLRMIASTIYWLRGDEVQFEGSEISSSTSTRIFGGIQGRAFMPYEVNLRWGE